MRRISFVMIVALIVGALMISCNSEVGTNSGSDSLAKVSVSLGSDSKALTATPSSSITHVEDLNWYYVATKTDTGLYATGATEWSAVPTTGGTASDGQQMVQGRLLNRFSKGSWSFSFYGYKDETSSKPGVPKNTAVYYAENIPVNVNGDTSVNVELRTGALDLAKVKFDSVKFKTTGLNINSYAAGNFTLQISGLGDTITSDPVAYASNTSEYTFKFSSQTSKTVENLAAGNYTVTFQVLFGGVVVAEETKNITVSAGTIVTFSGDVLSTDPTYTVVIGNITSTTTATASVNADPVNAITIQNSITPVSSTATSTANVTTVSFPAESLATQSSAATAVVLEMTVYDTAAAAANSSFTVNSSSASAALDLVLTVGNQSVTSFNDKYVAVSTYIATGLQNVTVGTTGDAVVFDSANTNPDASACLSDGSTTGTGYNSSTGLLVFKTNHFSSFYVNSSNEAINITTNVAYATLTGALSDSGDNQTIMLLKNIQNSDVGYVVSTSITLDGNKHSLTSKGSTYSGTAGDGSNNEFVHVIKVDGLNVTIKNFTDIKYGDSRTTCSAPSYKHRTIVVNPSCSSLTLDNVRVEDTQSGNGGVLRIERDASTTPSQARTDACTVVINKSTLSSTQYGFYIGGKVNATINGSTFNGWNALYFKKGSDGSSIAFNKTSINEVSNTNDSNPMAAPGGNGFGAVAFESGQNSLTFTDCAFDMKVNGSAGQTLFLGNDWSAPTLGNTIIINGSSTHFSSSGTKEAFLVYSQVGGTQNICLKVAEGARTGLADVALADADVFENITRSGDEIEIGINGEGATYGKGYSWSSLNEGYYTLDMPYRSSGYYKVGYLQGVGYYALPIRAGNTDTANAELIYQAAVTNNLVVYSDKTSEELIVPSYSGYSFEWIAKDSYEGNWDNDIFTYRLKVTPQ